jgi:hypothetical protein
MSGLAQARGVACMVIIICVRLLNLAVPILYKKVRGICRSPLCSSKSCHSRYLGTPWACDIQWFGCQQLGCFARQQVVDVLADITNGTHPRPGDKPEHYTFMQAFYPFVLLYIGAYFVQVLPFGTSATSDGLQCIRCILQS